MRTLKYVLLWTLFFNCTIKAQCIMGGTIFATFTNTFTLSQPPSFVLNLNYEICNPGFVTDTSGGNATRNYYLGGGELQFKAFNNTFIAMKTGAKLTILGGSNFITIMHEPGVTIVGAGSSTITSCSPIAFPSPNSCGSVGLNEAKSTNSKLEVFPNPTNGIINVNGCASEEIRVFNMLGELVLVSELRTNNYQLNISEQPSGIYFVKVGLINKKIVKE